MSGKGFFSGAAGFLITFVVAKELEGAVSVSGRFGTSAPLAVVADNAVGADALKLAL